MRWEKRGHIFSPNSSFWWSRKYALYPTPIYLAEENCIRVYYGTIDDNFFGRTSFIDLDADDPSIIQYNPEQFTIDLGPKGAFDDCGATPACAIIINSKQYLYYSGFCRSFQSPYHIFSGLSIANKGASFEKQGNVPVLDRTNGEFFDRAGQCVIYDEGLYKTWYVSGVRWETINSKLYQNKQMPVHTIRYATSLDGKIWNAENKPCIDFENEEEFGFGRPWVIKDIGIYRMWYSIRKKNFPYRIGYAESKNGIDWERKDLNVGITVSPSGWDSEMICYAAVIKVKKKTYMFHNGNNNGETGFGYAELEAD